MVQQIVSRRDLREHVAYFSRSVRLARGALRTSALYRRAGSAHFATPRRLPAAASKRGVKPRTRSTACSGTESYVRALPIRGERTKRSTPLRDFLSERMPLNKAAGGTLGQGGRGSRRRTNEMMRETSGAGVTLSSWPRKAAAIIPQATASPCW